MLNLPTGGGDGKDAAARTTGKAYSADAAGAGVASAGAAGASCTGAAGTRGFGAGFLAGAAGGVGAALAERDGAAARAAGGVALAAEADAADARGVDAVVAGDVPGSGFMMLTAGVEEALGNSALVGLPVGTEPPSAARAPTAVGTTGGAFQDGA